MRHIELSNDLLFETDNNGITEEDILNIIPRRLRNKEDFIEFYLKYNEAFFPDGAFVRRSRFYEIKEDEYDELEVEIFYNIKRKLNEIWEATKENSKEAKEFAEEHMPFAGDAAGNDFWVEISTGIIKYISWEDDFPEAITIAAPNFREFCLAIEPYR